MENMHVDITVYRLGVTLMLHVNETKVMRLDETLNINASTEWNQQQGDVYDRIYAVGLL